MLIKRVLSAALVMGGWLLVGCGGMPPTKTSTPPSAYPPTTANTSASPASPATRSSADPTSGWSTLKVTSQAVPFALRVPATWKLEGSVFMEGNTKAAEFSPGVVTFSPGQTCAGILKPGVSESPIAVVSQTAVAFGGLAGIRQVEKVAYEDNGTGGTWYPVLYCVSRGKIGFVMAFYAPANTPTQQKSFDAVMATLRLGSA